MRVKRRKILALFVALMLAASLQGCTPAPDPSASVSDSGGGGGVSAQPGPSGAGQTHVRDGEVPVTQDETIEWLWSDYIYDGITTLINTEFESVSSAQDKIYFINYALARLGRQGESLVPGFDVMSEELTRHFGSSLDLDAEAYEKILTGEGTGVGQQLLLSLEYWDSTQQNPWQIEVGQVFYSAQSGTYTIELRHIANAQTGRVGRVDTCILRERSRSELYFESITRVYPETNFIKLEGSHTPVGVDQFDISGDPYTNMVNLSGRPLGDGRLLLERQQYQWAQGQWDESASYLIFNPGTGKVEARFSLPEGEGENLLGVTVTPDHIIFKLQDKYIRTDHSFGAQQSHTLPDEVASALAGQDAERPSYDIDAQMRYLVWADEGGIRLWDLQAGSSRAMAQVDELDGISQIVSPLIAGAGKSIVADCLTGDGLYSCIVQFVEGGAIQEYADTLGTNWLSAEWNIPVVRYDDGYALSGLEFVDVSAPTGRNPEGTVPIVFDNAAQQQPLGEMPSTVFYNGRYLAYIASENTASIHPEDQVYALVRIDFTTMRAETILRVTAGLPVICALTAQGQVLLSYSFEREIGYCLAP